MRVLGDKVLIEILPSQPDENGIIRLTKQGEIVKARVVKAGEGVKQVKDGDIIYLKIFTPVKVGVSVVESLKHLFKYHSVKDELVFTREGNILAYEVK